MLEYADELKQLRIKIENNENSEFDFYRYISTSHETISQEDKKKSRVKKMFKKAILNFFDQYKKQKKEILMEDENNFSDKLDIQTLQVLHKLEKQRKY